MQKKSKTKTGAHKKPASKATKGKKVSKLTKEDLKDIKGGGPIPARCCTYRQK